MCGNVCHIVTHVWQFKIWPIQNWFLFDSDLQPAVERLTFGRKEVIKTNSISMLFQIPRRIKSLYMRKHYQSVCLVITQLKTFSAPPPFDSASFTFAHFVSLFPVCSILLLLSGKLLKSPVDTASSTTSASWRRGFTALFLPGEDNNYHHWRRGDIPRGPGEIRTETPGLPSTRLSEVSLVYLLYLISTEGLIKFLIWSHLTQSSLSHKQLQWDTHSFEEKGHPRFQVKGNWSPSEGWWLI